MKGFFTWFKNGTKLKRWILLIIIGIVLSCYGVSEVIVPRTLSFFDIAKIIVIFVIGFTCIIISLIYMQKRTLEILVQDNNLSEAKTGVKSLIFNKNVYDNGPKIVAIGGGTGLESVLAGFKRYTNNITAIVTVSDYGIKPTSSRAQLELPPLEDIKGSIAALSPSENHMEKLFAHKFTNSRLKDIAFGDIYMLAMKDIYGSITESIKESKNVLNITGQVLPVTLDEMTICAELKDGTVVIEKEKIPEVAYEKISKIDRMYISPSNVKPAPGVIEAIKEADAIIIGPGSLYTNIIPNLLVKGVSKAIKESKAKKVYVSNIMTEPGQTDNYTVSEHIKAIIEHTGKGIIDFCICDTGEIIPEFIRRYNQMGADLVEQDVSKIDSSITVLQRDLSCIKDDFIRHDSNNVAGTVIEVICDDLKFKDKKNDKQYVLLNSELKEHKKERKVQRKEKKKDKNVVEEQRTKKVSSKFAEKYSDRIKSIQESEAQREKNSRIQKEAKQKAIDDGTNVIDIPQMEKIDVGEQEVVIPEKIKQEEKSGKKNKTEKVKKEKEKKEKAKRAKKKKPVGKRMNTKK